MLPLFFVLVLFCIIYKKSIKNSLQYHTADGDCWVPRLTLLDLTKELECTLRTEGFSM